MVKVGKYLLVWESLGKVHTLTALNQLFAFTGALLNEKPFAFLSFVPLFLCNAVLGFLSVRRRSAAPHTPRVLLLGPTGAGKSVQAAMLAEKYRLVDGKLAAKEQE